MEKKAFAILEYIVDASNGGQAIVVDGGELSACLPVGSECDVSAISAIVKELALNNLISLKYADAGTFCVQPKEQGIVLVETEQKKGLAATIARQTTTMPRSWLISLLGGFFGGLIAVGLAVAVYFLVRALG